MEQLEAQVRELQNWKHGYTGDQEALDEMKNSILANVDHCSKQYNELASLV